MFKAFDTQLDRHVVSLDPVWDEQIEALRGWGRAGRLVCPVCRQAVLLRAGEIMRRHFAHKDLSQCPLGHESAEVLAGRAALYAWLNTKFPVGVTLEKHFEADSDGGYQLPRGVDCWVERPGKRSLAYWLVDGKIEPDERMQIPRFLAARNAALNWLFLPRDARRGRLPGRVNLSATERELLTPSEFDAVYCASGISEGSLHCLDPESQVLTTYRALVCVEAAAVLRRLGSGDRIEAGPGPAQHRRIRPSRRVRAAAGPAGGTAPARGSTPQGSRGRRAAASRTRSRGPSRRRPRRGAGSAGRAAAGRSRPGSGESLRLLGRPNLVAEPTRNARRNRRARRHLHAVRQTDSRLGGVRHQDRRMQVPGMPAESREGPTGRRLTAECLPSCICVSSVFAPRRPKPCVIIRELPSSP